MKKRNVVVVVLLIALLLMGSAYAAWRDNVVLTVDASSGTMDVLFVNRVVDETGATYAVVGTPDPVDAGPTMVPADAITETVDNLVPGEEVVLTYTIENFSTIDVLLENVAVAHTGGANDLTSDLTITWTVDDSTGTGTHTQGPATLADHSVNVSAQNIKLEEAASAVDADKQCTLVVTIGMDAALTTPYSTEHSTVFTITPQFVQAP